MTSDDESLTLVHKSKEADMYIVGSAQLQGLLTATNDDEAEKRERRRSKVLELQRRHHDIGSPATPDTPDDR